MMEQIENGTCSSSTQKKNPKRGIIYLSTIPPYMNVTKIREIFNEYGTLGRVYLQLAETDSTKKSKKKKIGKKFTEGWIEFERKSIAKKVAQILNNQQVSNRKKSKHYDHMWNIKYLPGFKWTHLHERLAYEKAARRQKLRAEIQLAKKKTNFFTVNLGKSKKSKQGVNQNIVSTESEVINTDINTNSETVENRDKFIKSLFN